MVVRLGGFALDTGQRTLRREDRRVHLTRKAFDLLALLIAEAPRVVSKDELHTQLWRGTFITDATLAGVIKEVRRALCDSVQPLIPPFTASATLLPETYRPATIRPGSAG